MKRKVERPPQRRPTPPDDRRSCPICLARVAPERYADHYARCLCRRAELDRLEAVLSSPEPEERGPLTSEGYPIGHCPLCRRRVGLVPDGTGGYKCHEIVRLRADEPHCCDGQPSGGRRGKLLYLNPEVATTERVNRSRLRPKDGGPHGA